MNLWTGLQSITFDQLKVQAGQDAGGIGTDMITMNATLRMVYRNTGTFFGVHVTSSPIDLSFSQITIGSGTVSTSSVNAFNDVSHVMFIDVDCCYLLVTG